MSAGSSRNQRGAVALSLVINAPELAGDITVLAAGAAKKLVARIDAPFTQSTGHRIRATFDTVGAQRDKLGLIDTSTIRNVGDLQVGLAVSANSIAPDISTPEALRKALLAAKSIAYDDPARGATAGTHVADVLSALGLNEQVSAKVAVLPFGVEVIEAVAAGRFELGVSQSSEIVATQRSALHRRRAGATPTGDALSDRRVYRSAEGISACNSRPARWRNQTDARLVARLRRVQSESEHDLARASTRARRPAMLWPVPENALAAKCSPSSRE